MVTPRDDGLIHIHRGFVAVDYSIIGALQSTIAGCDEPKLTSQMRMLPHEITCVGCIRYGIDVHVDYHKFYALVASVAGIAQADFVSLSDLKNKAYNHKLWATLFHQRLDDLNGTSATDQG
jgi:hypothetical protein